MKTYAVIRKTYPPRRIPRQPYIFLLKLETWQRNGLQLTRMTENGGPKYELLTTLERSTKQDALARLSEMFPGERLEEREVY